MPSATQLPPHLLLQLLARAQPQPGGPVDPPPNLPWIVRWYTSWQSDGAGNGLAITTDNAPMPGDKLFTVTVGAPNTTAHVGPGGSWASVSLPTHDSGTSFDVYAWELIDPAQFTTHTWSIPGGRRAILAALIRNAGTMDEADSLGTASANTHAAPTVITAGPNRLIMAFCCNRTFPQAPWAPNTSAGYLERVEVVGTDGTTNVDIALQTRPAPTAGSYADTFALDGAGSEPAIIVVVAYPPAAAGGPVSHSADASLPVTATLTTAGVVEDLADAALVVTASLSTAAVVTDLADAALPVTATLAAAAARTATVTAGLAATATLSAGATLSAVAAAALPAVATLTAGAVVTDLATAALPVTATLAAAAQLSAIAAATLPIVATLSAGAVVGTPPVPIAAALAVSVTLTASATRTALPGASLAVTATLATTAGRATLPTASLTVTAALTAGRSLSTTVGAVLAVTAALTAAAGTAGAFIPALVGLDGGTSAGTTDSAGRATGATDGRTGSSGHDGTLKAAGSGDGTTTATGLW